MTIFLAGHDPRLQTGLAKIGFNLSLSLAELEHDVNYFGITGKQLEPAGNDIMRIYPYDVIKTAIKSIKPDMIITVGDLWLFENVYEIAKHTDVPWVAYFGSEGITYPSQVRVKSNEYFILDKMREKIAWTLAYTQATVDALRQTERISILPHSMPKVIPQPNYRYNLRKIFNIPKDKKIALFVGDNIFRKGIDIFIDVISRFPDYVGYIHSPSIREHGINLRDARLGKHNIILREDLEAAVMNNDFTNNDIMGLYFQADLYYHPHRAEGFGLTILEALTAGRRVLATATGGPNMFLPEKCKLKPTKKIYIPGNVGYWAQEPDSINIDIEGGAHSFNDKDFAPYTFDVFKANVKSFLETKIEAPIWHKA